MTLTQALVREVFELDEVTGILYHRKSRQGGGRVGGIAGKLGSRGTCRVSLYGKEYIRSRLVFLYVHGWLPEQVDHRDRNSLNDRPDNLRPATHAQNIQNIERRRGKLPVGVIVGSTNTFQASIKANGKRIYLGSFKTDQEAHEAYRAASLQHHGEFSRFANDPRPVTVTAPD